jgi:hypothetical protein
MCKTCGCQPSKPSKGTGPKKEEVCEGCGKPYDECECEEEEEEEK